MLLLRTRLCERVCNRLFVSTGFAPEATTLPFIRPGIINSCIQSPPFSAQHLPQRHPVEFSQPRSAPSLSVRSAVDKYDEGEYRLELRSQAAGKCSYNPLGGSSISLARAAEWLRCCSDGDKPPGLQVLTQDPPCALKLPTDEYGGLADEANGATLGRVGFGFGAMDKSGRKTPRTPPIHRYPQIPQMP